VITKKDIHLFLDTIEALINTERISMLDYLQSQILSLKNLIELSEIYRKKKSKTEELLNRLNQVEVNIEEKRKSFFEIKRSE
jgi:hypothetical protein